MSDNLVPLLLVLGLGGVAIWLLMKPAAPAPAAPCGVPVSAYGVGTVLPCSSIKTVTSTVAGGVKAVFDAKSYKAIVSPKTYTTVAGAIGNVLTGGPSGTSNPPCSKGAHRVAPWGYAEADGSPCVGPIPKV